MFVGVHGCCRRAQLDVVSVVRVHGCFTVKADAADVFLIVLFLPETITLLFFVVAVGGSGSVVVTVDFCL